MSDAYQKKDALDPFDESYFNRLFEEFYTPLCQYAIRMVADRSLAEDIVQEQFVYLWERRNEIVFGPSIKSYLFISVRNKSLNYLKKHYSNSHPLEIETLNGQLIGGNFTAEELIEGAEMEEMVERAIAELPHKCRTIFLMKRFGEQTNKEISDQLAISVKTVEAQMTIAIRKLKAYLFNEKG